MVTAEFSGFWTGARAGRLLDARISAQADALIVFAVLKRLKGVCEDGNFSSAGEKGWSRT